MPFSSELFVYTLLALLSPFSSTDAAPHHRRPKIHHTLDVDPSGRGHFTTIQAAIDAVSSHNQHWTCIRVKKGVYRWTKPTSFAYFCFFYTQNFNRKTSLFNFIFLISSREQVTIPYEKPLIFLKGQGKRNTYITWDAHDSIATSATFSSYADNTIAQSISFVVRKLFSHTKSHSCSIINYFLILLSPPSKPEFLQQRNTQPHEAGRCSQDTRWQIRLPQLRILRPTGHVVGRSRPPLLQALHHPRLSWLHLWCRPIPLRGIH